MLRIRDLSYVALRSRREMPRHHPYNPPLDKAAVKKRLKELRARLSLNQHDTAVEAEIAPRTFQSWENCEVLPGEESYDLLAAFYSRKLGVEINRSDILYGTPDLPDPLPDDRAGYLALEERMRTEFEERIDGLRLELIERFDNKVEIKGEAV